ncbi:MAG: hypothetical protein A3F11_04160 [Gammaproteobacteria bacterium RIFCSPHIGHO2_12_FULL_37_14]|nr:MAG: hypothetical protein A3F11_04160 [Gammaproteobacteria bacterium RIFCSPHIGHO2_12_FULL_37_14]
MPSISSIDPEQIKNCLLRDDNLNKFLYLIDTKKVVMAMTSITCTTFLQNSYLTLSRVTERILYFDHSDNKLLREYRLACNREMFTDFEDGWKVRESFYKLHFSMAPSSIINHLYQTIKKTIGYIEFDDYCQLIEDLVHNHIKNLLANPSGYYAEFVDVRTDTAMQCRIHPNKLAECINLAFRGYRNDTTFRFKKNIKTILSNDLLILDGYAFDVNELNQLSDEFLYINPYTKQKYSLESEKLLMAYAMAQATVNIIEKNLSNLNRKVSQTTIQLQPIPPNLQFISPHKIDLSNDMDKPVKKRKMQISTPL